MIHSIRNTLVKRWPKSLDLLKALEDKRGIEFACYLRSGSTTELMDICSSFKGSSLYGTRLDPLPFDNDVYAIDAARCLAHNQTGVDSMKAMTLKEGSQAMLEGKRITDNPYMNADSELFGYWREGFKGKRAARPDSPPQIYKHGRLVTSADTDADLLSMSRINSVSPIVVEMGGSHYDLEFVCVETGLARIDVSGLSQNCEWTDFSKILDWNMNEYDPDLFYADCCSSFPSL